MRTRLRSLVALALLYGLAGLPWDVVGFNYKDVINGKNTDQNIPLKAGDQIVVP